MARPIRLVRGSEARGERDVRDERTNGLVDGVHAEILIVVVSTEALMALCQIAQSSLQQRVTLVGIRHADHHHTPPQLVLEVDPCHRHKVHQRLQKGQRKGEEKS